VSSLPAGSSVSPGSGSPLSVTGLATGLNTSAIIAALMAAERQPVTRLGTQQEKLTAAQQQLQSVRSSLRSLAAAVSEFSLPSLFESAQTVSSSEPSRIAAATTSGAGVGGYEVEVKRLASSAQRTFAFTSPAAEDAINIDGLEYKLAAGSTAKTLAEEINADGKGTVYAAVIEGTTIVLSTRATGATGAEFIKVTDPGGVLAEKAGTAKEGFDAEFSVDGVEGKATSNTVTNAIPGVTLSLLAPTPAGPVTISVQPPGPSVSAIENQLKAFVSTYNSTVEAIQKQLTTKPPPHPTEAKEYGIGTLFGDLELSSLMASMRQAMYEPIEGLPGELASPSAIGLSTGAASSGAGQGSIEGLLKLEPAKLASAVQANPAGVEKMLQQWSAGLQKTIEGVAQVGGSLESRITSDSHQVSELRSRIASMNEILLTREKSLQRTYAELEGILSQNLTQSNWLVSQSESLIKSGL
jgi:flagellar hook-associated protein 2